MLACVRTKDWFWGSKGCDFELVPKGGFGGGLHLPAIKFVHVQPKLPLLICNVILVLSFFHLEVSELVLHLVALR